MLFVSHRGNLEGRDPTKENYPGYLLDALEKGFHVEVDVWVVSKKVFFGHDHPQYEVDLNKFPSKSVFFHCKNLEAVDYFLKEGQNANFTRFFFYQEGEGVSLIYASDIFWCYKRFVENGIIMLDNEIFPTKNLTTKRIAGVCSDNIKAWKKLYDKI